MSIVTVTSTTYEIDGWGTFIRVTKAIDAGYAKFWLANWKKRQVAECAFDRLADWAGLERDDAVKFMMAAPDETTRKAGDRGTDIHGIAESIMAGKDPAPWLTDDDMKTQAAALTRFKQEWVAEILATETRVFHEQLRYAGTFDMVARLNDGHIWMLDWKSGKGIYPDYAIQQEAYLRATHMVVGDAVAPSTLGVDVTRCGLVHVRDGQAVLHEITVDHDIMWAAFQSCLFVAEYQAAHTKQDSWKQVRTPPTAREPNHVAAHEQKPVLVGAEYIALHARLSQHIRSMTDTDYEALEKMWPEGCPGLRDNPTGAQLLLIEKTVADVYAFRDIQPERVVIHSEMDEGVIAVLKDRVAALPADLAEQVTVHAKRAGIPNIDHHTFNQSHYTALTDMVARAETQVLDRVAKISGLADGDPEVERFAGPAPTAGDVDNVAMIRSAIDSGLLAVNPLRVVTTAIPVLVRCAGGSSKLLKTAQALAAAVGAAKPVRLPDIHDPLFAAMLQQTVNNNIQEEPTS